MAFGNFKSMLSAGESFRDKFVLALAVASRSRPGLGKFLKYPLRLLSEDGSLHFAYKESATRQTTLGLIRLDYLGSDVLTFLELGARDCYRVPRDLCPCLVVDGGANLGLFTLGMARRWPEAKYVLCEPLPDNVRAISQNLADNNVSAQIEPCCLGKETSSARFKLGDANSGSLFGGGDSRFIDVAVRPLSDFVTSTPALVKLDIEGAELDVLEDFLRQPRNDVYIVGELHNWPVNEEGFTNILRRAGWTWEFFERDEACLLFHAFAT
jgi:FkbM family methyltransferase